MNSESSEKLIFLARHGFLDRTCTIFRLLCLVALLTNFQKVVEFDRKRFMNIVVVILLHFLRKKLSFYLLIILNLFIKF